MGMAASQARFLGLTARKTNVEYEGQQINQQRTSLANQSANYYNDLLGMTVPTPPSVSEFTKTVYTFQDGNLANSITALIAQPDGKYLVSYTSTWTNDFAPVSAGSAILTRKGTNPDYKYNFSAVELDTIGKRTYACFDKDGNKLTDVKIDKDAKGDYQWQTVTGTPYSIPQGASIKVLSGNEPSNDPYLSTLSSEQLLKLFNEETEYKTLLDKKYGAPTKGWLVRYQQNTASGTWSPVFYKKDDAEKAIYSDKGTSQSNIPAYKMGTAQETKEIKGETARLEKDATGRYINITLRPGASDSVTYSLTTNTLTDQDAYDDAMNQYEYNKNQYDQSINEINSKIEIIQAQDKNLELRLKQLDTEQDAISNEMDAVQKVIEKNTESTFKTFG